MNTEYIVKTLKYTLVNGYFYEDNCRITYSNKLGFFCKDHINGKMNVYSITESKAIELIDKSLID